MRIRLIAEDEPPIVVQIGDSEIDVARLSEAARRAVHATHRARLRAGKGAQDPEALAAYVQTVEDDLLDLAIKGWRHVDGDPPCTRANKLLLPEVVKEAVRAARDSAARLDLEAAEKNSAPPSGSAAS